MAGRRGRPLADPACGVPPEHLALGPVGVLEADDGRFEHFAGVVPSTPWARPIVRWTTLEAASDALRDARAHAGLVAAHEVEGRSSHELLSGFRARARRLPMFVTLPAPDPRVNARCRAAWMAYLPGTLDPVVVRVMLEEMERYESARLDARAFVVRRAMRLSAGDPKARLRPHEAAFAAAELEGAPVWELTDGAGRKAKSAVEVRSRIRRKMRASSDALRLDWRLARALYLEDDAS